MSIVDRVHVEKANNAEDDEASNDLVQRIAERDDESILHSMREAGVVGGIGGEVAEADTNGEEDLTTRCLPDVTAPKLLAMPLSKVVSDATNSVGQRSGAAKENDEHDDRKSHSDPNSAAGQGDAAKHGKPDTEPDEGGPSDSLADEAQVRVLGVLDDAAAFDNSRDGSNIGDDIVVKEIIDTTIPSQRAMEGHAKVVHNPAQDGHVVCNDDVSRKHDAKANTLEPIVHAVVGRDYTSAIGLSDGNLEEEYGDSEEEKGDEVRNEPLETAVRKNDGRISQNITEAHGAALDA